MVVQQMHFYLVFAFVNIRFRVKFCVGGKLFSYVIVLTRAVSLTL